MIELSPASAASAMPPPVIVSPTITPPMLLVEAGDNPFAGYADIIDADEPTYIGTQEQE